MAISINKTSSANLWAKESWLYLNAQHNLIHTGLRA